MRQFLLIMVVLTAGVNAGEDGDVRAGKQVRSLHFSWNDCAPRTEGSILRTEGSILRTERGILRTERREQDAAVIKSLEVSPDPIIIPGNVSIGFELDSNVNLTSPSPFFIRIQKKVAFFWVDVPCQDGQGSCDYDDFCDKWPIPGPTCPDAYRGNNIPCECPFTAREYRLPLANVGHVEGGNIPKWLENGEYKVKAWVTDPKSGQMLLCVNLDLNLKAG